jgi:hypothetical protein
MKFSFYRPLLREYCVVIMAFIMVFYALFILGGCSREKIPADRIPPPTPEFVARSADTALVQQGIAAVANDNSILLPWQISPAEDLGGYRIYRQVDTVLAPPADMIADLPITELAGDSVLYFTDGSPTLSPDSGRGFFYWISAYDLSGNESSLSASAYYRLLPQPGSLAYANALPDSLTLSWNFTENLNQVAYFMVRLYYGDSDTAFWKEQHDQFSDFHVSHYGNLPAGVYRFKVDVVGSSDALHPSGSAASEEFTIP